jgi:DNA-binding NarL/FixJ family response regulator
MFAALGMDAFAERGRRELRPPARPCAGVPPTPRDQLTSQKDQIVLLARTGMSNPEIAAQLFRSARTVQYHPRKVFIEFEISSRHDLRQGAADGASAELKA